MKSTTLASLVAVLAASAHAAPTGPDGQTKIFTPWVQWADGNDCVSPSQGAALTPGRCMAVPGAIALYGRTKKTGMQVSFLQDDPSLNCDLIFYKNAFCLGIEAAKPVTKQRECFDVNTFGSVKVNCTNLLAEVGKGLKPPGRGGKAPVEV